jgi:hypothetical protein
MEGFMTYIKILSLHLAGKVKGSQENVVRLAALLAETETRHRSSNIHTYMPSYVQDLLPNLVCKFECIQFIEWKTAKYLLFWILSREDAWLHCGLRTFINFWGSLWMTWECHPITDVLRPEQNIASYLLKARTVKPAETAATRERQDKQYVTRCSVCGPRHIPTATSMHATIEELWEAVFSLGPCRSYIWRMETQASQSRESLESAVSNWKTPIGNRLWQ